MEASKVSQMIRTILAIFGLLAISGCGADEKEKSDGAAVESKSEAENKPAKSGGFVERSRKVSVMKTVVELRTALTNFYTEYRRFPALEVKEEGDWSGRSTHALVSALLAAPGSDKLNPRGIQFFTARKAKSASDAGLWESLEEVVLNDSWGNPFFVVIDSNFDNSVMVPEGSGEEKKIFSSVAVWSAGPDGVSGTADDIKSF
ncbi:MAG: hypothetical protein ACI8UO_002809 [Verrucomicrobiales bacterium]|jgi:hypothetical protein